MLLRLEHAWLVLLYLFELCHRGRIATTDAHRLHLALVLFVCDVGLGELLPVVVDLLVDQAVGLL